MPSGQARQSVQSKLKIENKIGDTEVDAYVHFLFPPNFDVWLFIVHTYADVGKNVLQQ